MHPHIEFAHVVFCACVQQRRQVPLRELYSNMPLRLPFASFACVRAVMRNRKSAKEKMWWKLGRAPACGEEARHHTFLHCAFVCGGFYSPVRTWLHSVCLEQCTFHGPLTHILVLVQHLILQWGKMNTCTISSSCSKKKKGQNKKARERGWTQVRGHATCMRKWDWNERKECKRERARWQERTSEFFVRVCVSIYPHASAHSLKHTHTRHLTCCFLSQISFFFAHQSIILYNSNNKSLFFI